jgi:hypothetical protein
MEEIPEAVWFLEFRIIDGDGFWGEDCVVLKFIGSGLGCH